MINLKDLDCGANTNFTDKSLSKLVKLKYLVADDNNTFTDECLDTLVNLTFCRLHMGERL